MENFKNLASTILMTFGSALTFVNQLEQWSRIVAALITIIIGIITLYRNFKKK
jgi:putative Mn2+ efflux pump MntP